MLKIDKLSFHLVYQKLLNLGDFLVDSLVGCLLYLVTAIVVSILITGKDRQVQRIAIQDEHQLFILQ